MVEMTTAMETVQFVQFERHRHHRRRPLSLWWDLKTTETHYADKIKLISSKSNNTIKNCE